jgi:cell division protein FtsA
VLQPLATAEAVLTEDEKSLGTAVIDIGGGTTDIAIFHEGNLCHTSVIPVGGSNFTNDIAIGLRTPAPEAEKIKKMFGCSMMSMVDEKEEIEIRYAGDRPAKKIPRQYLIEILQPRVVELFRLIKEDITGKGFNSIISSGAVLTGGSSLMEGMAAMAENVLDLPIRTGSSYSVNGEFDFISDPANATGIGIVLYGARETLIEQRANNGNGSMRMISKVKNWANEIFS